MVPALTGAVLAGSPVCPALGALARLSRLRGGAPAWVPVLQVPGQAAAQTVGHSAALRGAAGCPKLAGCRSGAHAPPARVVPARGVAAGGPCPPGQWPDGQKVPRGKSVKGGR